MSTTGILANMSRAWNRDPAGMAKGTDRTELAAALWIHDEDDVQEATGEPHTTTHTLCLPLGRYHAELRLDGRTSVDGWVVPNTFCLIRAGQTPWGVHRGRWRNLHIYLPDAVVSGLLRAQGVRASSVELIDPRCADDPAIGRIGRDILFEMRAGQPLSRLRMDAIGHDLAIQLLRRWSNLVGTGVLDKDMAKGGLAPWQVRRVSEYLEDHLAEDVSLAELGALVDLSTFHLCRAFKQSTGLPPHRWRHQKRMERARELLEGTNDPITEIAAAVGYDDPSRLAAGFKKAFGVTPTEYRRERRS